MPSAVANRPRSTRTSAPPETTAPVVWTFASTLGVCSGSRRPTRWAIQDQHPPTAVGMILGGCYRNPMGFRPRSRSRDSDAEALLPCRSAAAAQGHRNFTGLVGSEGPRPSKSSGVAMMLADLDLRGAVRVHRVRKAEDAGRGGKPTKIDPCVEGVACAVDERPSSPEQAARPRPAGVRRGGRPGSGAGRSPAPLRSGCCAPPGGSRRPRSG